MTGPERTPMMPAVVLRATDRRIALEDQPWPEPTADQVLVDVDLTGICGSDLHAASLPEMYFGGTVLGHEVTGTVRALGESVSGWSVGDRVAINPNGNVCGVCGLCRSGRSNFCAQATRESAIGLQHDGGLAAEVVVSPWTLHRIPDSMSRVAAAWVEPAATALRAVRRAGDIEGATVLVTGGGPIGQLIIRLARLAGAGRIILSEPSAQRRSFGRASGADLVIDSSDAEVLPIDVDILFESSGYPGATARGFDALRIGGTAVIVGSGPGFLLDPSLMILKELTIRGTFTYDDEFDAIIPLLADGSLVVEDLTTSIVPLSGALDAIESLRQGSVMKVLISPNATAVAGG